MEPSREILKQKEYAVPRSKGPLFGWPECQTIMSCKHADGILLRRFYLLQTKFISIYLHHLISSDEDGAMHDHPWTFVSILLTGGYYEQTDTGLHWRRWLSILFRPAKFRHFLVLEKPVWTLVFHFKRVRRWGFWPKDENGIPRFMFWKDYGKEWCD